MSSPMLSWVENLTEHDFSVCVNTELYSAEALFRVCYVFTDRCYIFLSPEPENSSIRIRLTRKHVDTNLTELGGEFSNELINQKVRLDVANETKEIRELIVAQAFSESALFDRHDSDASYLDDPRDIAR